MSQLRAGVCAFLFVAVCAFSHADSYSDALIGAYDTLYDAEDKIKEPRIDATSIQTREKQLTTRLAHLVGLGGSGAGTDSIDDIFRQLKMNAKKKRDLLDGLSEIQKLKAQDMIDQLKSLYQEIPNGYLPGTGPLESNIEKLFKELKMPLSRSAPAAAQPDNDSDTPPPAAPSKHTGG